MSESVAVVETKKKSAQIATAGVFAAVTLGFMLYGSVKFLPFTAQVTRAQDTIDKLSSETADLHQDIAKLEDRANDFQLVTFPQVTKSIDQRLAKLDDITGDNDQRVGRLEQSSRSNSEWIDGQVVRVTGRIKDHDSRDKRDDRIEARLVVLEKYVKNQMTDRQDVEISELQSEVESLRSLIGLLNKKIGP